MIIMSDPRNVSPDFDWMRSTISYVIKSRASGCVDFDELWIVFGLCSLKLLI